MSHPERDIIDPTQEFSRPVLKLWDSSEDLTYHLRVDESAQGPMYRALQFAFQITEKDIVAPLRYASVDRLYDYLGNDSLDADDILSEVDVYFDEHPVDERIVTSFTPDIDETGLYAEHVRVAAGLMCIMIEAEEKETRETVIRRRGAAALTHI